MATPKTIRVVGTVQLLLAVGAAVLVALLWSRVVGSQTHGPAGDVSALGGGIELLMNATFVFLLLFSFVVGVAAAQILRGNRSAVSFSLVLSVATLAVWTSIVPAVPSWLRPDLVTTAEVVSVLGLVTSLAWTVGLAFCAHRRSDKA